MPKNCEVLLVLNWQISPHRLHFLVALVVSPHRRHLTKFAHRDSVFYRLSELIRFGFD